MKNMRLTKLLLAVGIVALLGAGCAGAPVAKNGNHMNMNANANVPAIGTVPNKPASGSFTITIDADGEFDPVTAYVTKGTTVTIKNTTTKPHRIAPSYDPKSVLPGFESKGDLAPGASFTYTFNKVGRWLYEDSKHPGFGGAVDVSE
jgi:plastocyanin